MTSTKDYNGILLKNEKQNFIEFFFFYIDKPEFQSGTTATVCLLRDGIELIIGHVGDSRAILCREGYAIRLSEDHHPDNHREKERIQRSGGVVSHNSQGVTQVNGRLSMTRSLGDTELKKYGVIADPIITTKNVITFFCTFSAKIKIIIVFSCTYICLLICL